MGDGTRRYRSQNHWLVSTLVCHIIDLLPQVFTWWIKYQNKIRLWSVPWENWLVDENWNSAKLEPLYSNHDVQTTLPWQSVYVWEFSTVTWQNLQDFLLILAPRMYPSSSTVMVVLLTSVSWLVRVHSREVFSLPLVEQFRFRICWIRESKGWTSP